MAISSDNQYVAVSSNSSIYKVFSLKDRTLITSGIRFATYEINGRILNIAHSTASSIAFSPDGNYIVFGESDGRFFVDTIEGNVHQSFFDAHGRRINSVAMSDDNRFVVSGSDDGTARVWSMETG
jgi:WD40 repeat protein